LDALSKRLARLAQLNTPTNIPLSYRAYALICVDDPHTVERDIHKLIILTDDSLHTRETCSSLQFRTCTSVMRCYNRDEGSLMFCPQTVAPTLL